MTIISPKAPKHTYTATLFCKANDRLSSVERKIKKEVFLTLGEVEVKLAGSDLDKSAKFGQALGLGKYTGHTWLKLWIELPADSLEGEVNWQYETFDDMRLRHEQSFKEKFMVPGTSLFIACCICLWCWPCIVWVVCLFCCWLKCCSGSGEDDEETTGGDSHQMV